MGSVGHALFCDASSRRFGGRSWFGAPLFFFGDALMAEGHHKPTLRTLDPLPNLPFGERHWQAIFRSLRLSPRQIEMVALMLRDASNDEIVAELGISLGTLKNYWQRISHRVGVNSRMQLAMRILAVSYEVQNGLQVVQSEEGTHVEGE